LINMRNIGIIQTLDEQKGKKLFSVYIYIAVILSTVIGGYIAGLEIMSILRNVIISVIGVVTYLEYFHKNNSSMLFRMNNIRGYCIAFALSNILLVVNCGVFTGMAWLIGAAFAAIFDGIEHAAVTYGILMLQYMILILMPGKDISIFILYALIGVVLIILFTQIESMKTIPYASAVLIILTAILFIALNEFDIKRILHNKSEIVMIFISDAVFISLAVLSCVYKENQKDAEKQYKMLLQKKLMNVIEADYELVKKLHEYSAPLFIHSIKVSMLSRDAAEAVGADMFLAQAGGMYHEVGRIRNEKDYIKAGIELAYSYGFPEELISVIRQHSTGSEKPKSIEAAIVMLSDCIISTSEYLEKTGDRQAVSDEKLIESIFKNRIEKGNLEDTYITDEKIESLKKFYIENAFE